jgi:hypothetical protein
MEYMTTQALTEMIGKMIGDYRSRGNIVALEKITPRRYVPYKEGTVFCNVENSFIVIKTRLCDIFLTRIEPKGNVECCVALRSDWHSNLGFIAKQTFLCTIAPDTATDEHFAAGIDRLLLVPAANGNLILELENEWKNFQCNIEFGSRRVRIDNADYTMAIMVRSDVHCTVRSPRQNEQPITLIVMTEKNRLS